MRGAVLLVLVSIAVGVKFEWDQKPRPCPSDASVHVCTFYVQTTTMIPVISGYTELKLTGGTVADYRSPPAFEVSDCGTFLYLDGKEIQFRGRWEETQMEAAWVHPLNEPTRLDQKFPLMQIAMKGERPMVQGVLTITSSGHASGVYTEQVCCGEDCARDEL